MNRKLQYLNFFGIAALSVLCVFQWRANSRIDQDRRQLASICQSQRGTISEDERALEADTAAMGDLNGRLTAATGDLLKERSDLAAANHQNDLLTAQCDDLKSALAKWTAAVAQRDAALKQAADEIQKAAADRDQAVKKYNDLAGQYNSIVASQNRN
jgi:chromosome segregation ATPase